MKLVGKVDSAINKVRSLTHFIGKKPQDGPCTLKLKVLSALHSLSAVCVIQCNTESPDSHLNLCAVQTPLGPLAASVAALRVNTLSTCKLLGLLRC